MDSIWQTAAQKYLSNVFYRRKVDAKANSGDKFAAAVIAIAAVITQ